MDTTTAATRQTNASVVSIRTSLVCSHSPQLFVYRVLTCVCTGATFMYVCTGASLVCVCVLGYHMFVYTFLMQREVGFGSIQ